MRPHGLAIGHLYRWPKRTTLERFEEKFIPEPNSGCWLWIGALNDKGYGHFHIQSKPRRAMYAHRFAWEQYNGPIPAGLDVCHRCDVPCCVNPEHLFLGTHDDNMADKARKGRCNARRGVACSWSKLTPDLVREIRRGGVTNKAWAERLGMAENAIRLAK